MARKRVLVVHPRVTDRGGGNGVAAWVLQALRDSCELSLLTLQPIDFAAVNRSWGTSLRDGDFRTHVFPLSGRFALRILPTRAALLELCLMMRLARRLDRLHPFDVVVGTQNEADFGRRGIHYIHYPWLERARPPEDLRWYHHLPGALAAYRGVCLRIAGLSRERMRQNLSIANSAFVAGHVRALHDVESAVVFPPVTGAFPEVAWEDRRSDVIAVGRLNGSKRWEMAVAIVEEVRRRGHELGLNLVGHRDDRAYQQRLERLAATRPWFRIHTDVSRDELVGMLVTHRFGIHAMENEHFGMGPAEIVRAGCILFAHASGGPREILGAESHLLFEDVGGAADRIERVLVDPVHHAALRTALAERRLLFSTEAFCTAMRQIVADFE